MGFTFLCILIRVNVGEMGKYSISESSVKLTNASALSDGLGQSYTDYHFICSDRSVRDVRTFASVNTSDSWSTIACLEVNITVNKRTRIQLLLEVADACFDRLEPTRALLLVNRLHNIHSYSLQNTCIFQYFKQIKKALKLFSAVFPRIPTSPIVIVVCPCENILFMQFLFKSKIQQ